MNSELEQLLAALMVYRPNPGYAERLRGYAESGDIHAQYALGLVYAEGRGVAPDPVTAYYWRVRAERQGDVDAQTLRYVVMQHMTASQIEVAQMRVAAFEQHSETLQ